jgi:hypothetical protein
MILRRNIVTSFFWWESTNVILSVFGHKGKKNQGLKNKTKKGLEQKKHPQELFKDYIFKPPDAENILVFPTSNL